MLVGIDLGTTNTCLAWAAEADGKVHLFEVPQLIGRGRGKAPLLPSALYAPLPGENASEPFCDGPWISGELARDRAAEVPVRGVLSAKSWLSHPGVDPTSPILPWGASAGDAKGAEVPRISPVSASARYLTHLKRAWNASHDELLEDCEIALTIPASFDDRARLLTLEAAKEAGLTVTLVEEPQAAFYDYMRFTRDETLGALANRHGGEARVLVVDVGGGTTDLSLIAVRRAKSGAVTFERIATGDHLLLGGDNMDLAIAEHAKDAFTKAPMTPLRFGQLVGACRRAKEKLFSERPPREAPVTLLGAGAKLVGSQETKTLVRDEVQRLVLEGFFPPTPLAFADTGAGKAGLVSIGLPYARDVAITRHIARFVMKHGAGKPPNAVLFNGGVFRSHKLRERLADVLSSWRDEPVEVLKERDPDLAVAKGAVAFMRARHGVGHKIRAGTTRSYYVAVKSDAATHDKRGMCILPHGAREGHAYTARERPLQLLTGEHARFELWRAETRTDNKVGDLVTLDEKLFSRLPPLVAQIDAPRGSPKGKLVDVRLSAHLSYVGTVEVSCVETDPPHPKARADAHRKHAFAFALRERPADARAASAPPAPTAANAPAPETLTPSARAPTNWASVPGPKSPKLKEAFEVIDRGFHSRAPNDARDVVHNLERTMGSRFQWTLGDSRAMFDAVMKQRQLRKASPEHERSFWQLASFTMRPGFGAPDDAQRMAQIWTLFEPMLAFSERIHNAQTFFVAWRRMAPGLDAATQEDMARILCDMIYTERNSNRAQRPEAAAGQEIRECLSYLERAPLEVRVLVGERTALLMKTNTSARLAEDLGRLGARVAMYAPESERIPADVVAGWVEKLLPFDFREYRNVAEACARMCRLSGDARANLPAPLRVAVIQKLRRAQGMDAELRAVSEFVPMSHAEWAQALGGDAVPVGLVLRD